MTQRYLVKYKSNWADEMNIYGLALLTEEDKSYIESLKLGVEYYLTHHVGTNEDIEYKSLEGLLDCYTWTRITESEYQTLNRLIGDNYGHFYYPEIEEEKVDSPSTEE